MNDDNNQKEAPKSELGLKDIITLAKADPKLAEQVYHDRKAAKAVNAFFNFQQNLENIPEKGVIFGKSRAGKKYVRNHYVYFDDLRNKVNKAMKDTGLVWYQTMGKPQAIHVPVLDKYGHPTGNISIGMKIEETTYIIYKNNGYQLPHGYICTVSQSLSPQDIGSAITYAKRYSLAMATGASSAPDNNGQQNRWHSSNKYPAQSGQQSYQTTNNKNASVPQQNLISKLIKQWAQTDGVGSDRIINFMKDQGMDVSNNGLPQMSESKASTAIKELQGFVNGAKAKQRA